MATLANWLIGRLYPTADGGLFFISEGLLEEDTPIRTRREEELQRSFPVQTEPPHTDLSAGTRGWNFH